jgi:hypothetical protein
LTARFDRTYSNDMPTFKNIFPPNGYRFQDADGTEFTAGSWPQVVAKVASYRFRAGRPVGNPSEDVMRQACKNNPQMCMDGQAPTQPTGMGRPLKSRLLVWLANKKAEVLKGTLAKLTDRAELDRRRATCQDCKNNTDVLSGGCPNCRKVAAELRAAVLKEVVSEKGLGACSVLGEDLPTSVRLEELAVESKDLPGNCWRKKTL